MLSMLKETIWRARYWQSRLRRTICAMALFALAMLPLPAISAQKSFVSPEAGVAALVEAVKSGDQPALRAILGPHGSKLVRSGDPVADERNRETFIHAYGEANRSEERRVGKECRSRWSPHH